MEKKLAIVAVAMVGLTLFSCKSAPKSDDAKTGEAQEVAQSTGTTLTVNTTQSQVEWIGTKVTAHHAGTIAIKSGELTIKDGAVNGGKFVLDMPSLISTNMDEGTDAKLTGHLKSPDFFDVAQYPEATFEITGIAPFTGTVETGDDKGQEEINQYKVMDPNYTISGNLTIKGITKNIEFPAKITMNGNTAEAIAKFNIDRKNWGITYPGMPDDLIKDQIWFGVSLKAAV